jgi:Domain of unknown function (DUF4177)
MAFEYKCVSGPTIVAVKNAKVRDQAVKAFEDIMNLEAAQGWEFVGIDEFHVSEPQGLLSRKRVYVPAKILVFRREKAGSALANALKARSLNTVAGTSVAADLAAKTGLAAKADGNSPTSDASPSIATIVAKVQNQGS